MIPESFPITDETLQFGHSPEPVVDVIRVAEGQSGSAIAPLIRIVDPPQRHQFRLEAVAQFSQINSIPQRLKSIHENEFN